MIAPMEYMVEGADGNQYGPVNVDAMKEWVTQGRINAQTTVTEFASGTKMTAGSVPGLFPSAAQSAVQSPFRTPMPVTAPGPMTSDAGKSELIGSIVRSVLAVVLFFFLHGLGLIFAGYAVFYAIQCQAKGNKYGVIAIVISVVALAAVGVGWLMRLNGARV
jgi:hypothetical protein